MIVQAPAAVVTTRKMNMVGWSIVVISVVCIIVGVSVLAAGIVKASNCSYVGFYEPPEYRTCTDVAASEIIAGVVILIAGLIFSCISCCACAGALCFADDVIIQQQPLAIMTTQNGQVQYAQPMYANAQPMYAAQPGQPMYAQPVQGQPMQGQPFQGQPVQGHQGQPVQGQPPSGYPAAPQIYPQGYVPQQQMYATQQSPALQHYSTGAQQTNEGFTNIAPPDSPSHKA